MTFVWRITVSVSASLIHSVDGMQQVCQKLWEFVFHYHILDYIYDVAQLCWCIQ